MRRRVPGGNGHVRPRVVRAEGWRGEPRAKASKFAARFGYELIFDYRNRPHKRGVKDHTAVVAAFLKSSGLRYRLTREVGTRRRTRVKVMVPGESEVLILRMADLPGVFRLYRLEPHKTA